MAHDYFVKKGVNYYDCGLCSTLFVHGGLKQADMVGGTGELERQAQNMDRFMRANRLAVRYNSSPVILDYGAGNGLMATYFNDHGLKTVPYDKYNLIFSELPEGPFDGVMMIEVVEHLDKPLPVMKQIHGLLKPGGFVIIESTFRTHQETQEDIDRWKYCNPEIGHCTLFSHAGLDALMARAELDSATGHVNDNVRVYFKEANTPSI
jgi:SAM-dependent methyltransferase